MATNVKKSSSGKARQDRFSWKSGDVQIYKNEAEWRKATKNKPKKKGK